MMPYRDKKQPSVYQELWGERGNRGETADGSKVSFWDDENIPKLHYKDDRKIV